MAWHPRRQLGLAAAGLVSLVLGQLDIECEEGRVVTLQDPLHSTTRLLGKCTLNPGGQLQAPHDARFRKIVVATNSELVVRGTAFLNIQLVVEEGAKLDVDGAWFYTTDLKREAQKPNFGGGILATARSDVRIVSSSFDNLAAYEGGGAIAIGFRSARAGVGGDCNLTVVDSKFRGTRAGADGGAIFSMGCRLVVQGCEFSNSRSLKFRDKAAWRPGESQAGGAIGAFRSDVRVSDSHFTGCKAHFGGNLYITHTLGNNIAFLPQVPAPLLSVTGCSFIDSRATHGAVVYSRGTQVHWNRVVVRWAKAKRRVDKDKAGEDVKKSFGGAVYCLLCPSLDLLNCLLEHVRCDGDGGAIYNIGEGATLYNVTFRDITAESNGGALYMRASMKCTTSTCLRVADLRQVTVERSTALGGGGLYILTRAGSERWTVRGSDLTFRDVRSTDGGGGAVLLQKLQEAFLEDVVVENASSVGHGGAIVMSDIGNASLTRLTVNNVNASQAGGAVYAEGSNLVITELEVQGGRARYGGALSGIFQSNITLTGANIRNCYATEFGGGLGMDEYTTFQASDVYIEDTECADEGGAVWLHLSSASFYNLTIVGAVAAIQGGAIFASVGTLSVENARFRSVSPNFAELGQLKAVSLKDLTLEGLQGRFLRILSSDVSELKVHGDCPPHTQLYGFGKETSQKNSTEFRCRRCDDDQGIQGLSSFDNRAKCVLCPPHSHGFSDDGCICDVGFVDNNSGSPGQRGGFPQCVSCEQMNLLCEPVVGLLLVCPPKDPECRPVWPADSFWRADDRPEPPLKCPYGPACVRSAESMCLPGYGGPKCMVCVQRGYRMSHFLPCRSCVRNLWTLVVCTLLVAAISVLMFATKSDLLREQFRGAAAAVGMRTSYLGNKVRFAIFTMQAFTTFPMLKTRPLDVVNTLTPTLNWLGCEVFASKSITVCLLGVGTYTRYVLMLLQIPLLFRLIGYFSILIDKDVNVVRLLAYNFMLMTIAKESFGFFVCDRVYSDTYLIGDYSIACHGATFRCFQCLAGTVLVVWCGLLPGLLLLQMYKQRHKINPAVPGFIGYDANTSDGLSIGLKLVEDHEQVLSYYGRAAMTQAARVFEQRNSPTEQDISNIRATAAQCVRTRLNSRSLLKQGRRAVLEAQDPELQSFRHLYQPYHPDRWYYEFVGLYGRVGFAAIMVLPRWLQCLAGLMLAAVLILSCLLQPFRRPSDTQVAATCYAAMGGIFVMEAVPSTTLGFRDLFSGACLLLPPLSLAFFAGKAYVLPSRGGTWNTEAADDLFHEEFCRAYGLGATGPEGSLTEHDAG